MIKRLAILVIMFGAISLLATEYKVISPNGNLKVSIFVDGGIPKYSVKYLNNTMIEDSPLGLITTVGDFSKEMAIVSLKKNILDKKYFQDRIKKSKIHYKANELIITLKNNEDKIFEILFRVSNNDIGFSYKLPQYGEIAICTIEKELSSFNFPKQTTTFLTPQAKPGTGWKNSKPSYEEEYVVDEQMGTSSKIGYGYTFPSLFNIGNSGWVLLSETGVSSSYCGSHLSEGTSDGIYTIAYPDEEENNGIGSANPSIPLPGSTPWRTITVGDNLQPIVETTITSDLVDPLYEPSRKYKFGRSTWSWIMWQDNSINFEDQSTYIDFTSELGFEYTLIDNWWDTNIGYEKMESLINYANSKNVDVFLWYSSNGYWNNAPQGPKNKMNNSVARKKEMKWLQANGVKGIKVDFFGGDKQETMKLYEDILVDANEHGLMVIFHGCTLPRGWERMYPNYVGSEAVLASENLIFTQKANDNEAFNATLHPFIRNAVGTMEFGPVLLNKMHHKTNAKGNIRRTSDVFQIATAVLFQSSVQMFALAPNNLTDAPEFIIDFMKNVPTTWDDTKFIAGYPGKYCVLARKHNAKWFVVGINAQDKQLELEVELPMLAGKMVDLYGDNSNLISFKDILKIDKDGTTKVIIQSNGGVILTQ